MAIGILKSSDDNWYQLSVVYNGINHAISIDQSPVSAPSPAWPEYWVIKNSSNGLNYKVYLVTSGANTNIAVDQTNVSEHGNLYEILYCSDDSSYHKITVEYNSISGIYILGVNTDKTNFGTVGGLSRININSKSFLSGISRVNINSKTTLAGLSRISANRSSYLTGISSILSASSTNKSYISGAGRLIHIQDSILQASDSNWYRFRLVLDGSDHVIDVDQETSPNAGTVPYWVLINPTDNLRYKVYLDIDGSVTLRVDQTDVSEPGEPYKLVYCITDQNYKKISVITEGSEIVLQINGDSTGRSSISGVSSIVVTTTTYNSSQAGIASIAVNNKANLTGISRIQQTLKGSIQGTSRIFGTVRSSISGFSRIGYSTVVSPISGVGRVANSYNSTTSGVASISVTVNSSSTQTGVARISNNNKATSLGVARIQKTIFSSQSGISRISAYVGVSTIEGTSRIIVRNRFKKSFIIRNEFNNNSPIIIQ